MQLAQPATLARPQPCTSPPPFVRAPLADCTSPRRAQRLQLLATVLDGPGSLLQVGFTLNPPCFRRLPASPQDPVRPRLSPPAPLDAPTPGRSGVAGSSSPQMLYSCPYDYPPGALPNGFGGWCFTNATACAAGASPSRKQAPAKAAGRAAAAE